MNPWTPVELAGWAAQIAAIGFLLLFGVRASELRGPPVPTDVACALVLALGWAWRLLYQFVLASSGFWYFVADDPCRWFLAWQWAVNPYVITWDGVWQGATFYVHGLAMRIGSDPLVGSKFVSALYPLIALLGIFLFTQGVYRDRTLAAASVIFLSPWWLHILLGTGTMTELPVLGFLLGGAGLFFIGLRSVGRRRRLALAFAAASFAIATAFHIVAWMALATILAVAFVSAATRGRDRGFGLQAWLVFLLLATSYCWLWFIGCWIKFGQPLAFIRNYAETTRVIASAIPLGRRLLSYPEALVFSVFGFLPLAVYGVISGVVRRSEERNRVRCVIAAAAAFLLILVAASVRNPGGPPFRLTITLAGALVPISLAPLRLLARTTANSRHDRRSLARLAVLAFIAVSWFLGNHLKTIGLPHSVQSLDADAISLGVWIRQEIAAPQTLDRASLDLPIRLWLHEPSLDRFLGIVYASGLPSRVQEWKGPNPGISSMKRGQYLVTDRAVDDPALAPQKRHGRYTVYQLQPAE